MICMNKLRKGELIKQALLLIAGTAGLAALTISLAAAPGLGVVAKEILDWYKNQGRNRREAIRKTFSWLRRHRLIEEREVNGRQILTLTEGGRKRVLEYKLDEVMIKPLKKWDRIWRIIIFDVPEKYKKAREALRSKLKLWGCYPLQKSIWITPYPCRDEIDFIIEIFKISPHVRIIEASNFDGMDEVRYFFNL